MQKNVILCATGIFLGFLVGFFVANAVTRPGATAGAGKSPAAAPAQREAGPLDPTQSSGPLPPGHPDINDADTGAPPATAASTSAEAQGAMSKADAAPKDFAAQVKAGEVFYNLHDYKKAALYLDRALAIKPADFDALVLAGNNRYDDKDFEGAARFYERALAVNPNSPDVRTDYGNTFYMRTPPDFDRAIAEYRKSVAVDPRHANSWKNIASAAIQKRDRAAAAEAVERLAAVEPNNADLPSFRQSLDALPR